MNFLYAIFLIFAAMFGLALAEKTYYYYPSSQEQHQKHHGHQHKGVIGRGENAIKNFFQ